MLAVQACSSEITGGIGYTWVDRESYVLRAPDAGEDGWEWEDGANHVFRYVDGEIEAIEFSYPEGCWPDEQLASLDGRLILSGYCGISEEGWGRYATIAVDDGDAMVIDEVDISELSRTEDSFVNLDMRTAWASTSEHVLYQIGTPCPLLYYSVDDGIGKFSLEDVRPNF